MRGKKILILSNIEWTFIWQRHQTLATLMAKKNQVLFCEMPGLRRVRIQDLPRIWQRLLAILRPPSRGRLEPGGNLILLRPFILPATNPFFSWINRVLLWYFTRRKQKELLGVDLLWVFSVSRTSLDWVRLIPHKALVYDCTDNWLAVKGAPPDLGGNERALLAAADLTIASSPTLFEMKKPWARRIEVVEHGVMYERFDLPESASGAPSGCRLLYFGHVHRQHLDVELIAEIARERPDWTIELVGTIKEQYSFPANVRLFAAVPHEKLKDFMVRCQVIILPYARNAYTNVLTPAKIYECLASGLPVVATPLTNLKANFEGYLRFGETAEEFIQSVEEALRCDTAEARARRKQLAAQNTWDIKYRMIESFLERAVPNLRDPELVHA